MSEPWNPPAGEDWAMLACRQCGGESRMVTTDANENKTVYRCFECFKLWCLEQKANKLLEPTND